MKIKGFNTELHPGITMHKIPVKAGFPGLVFTIGMLAVFLMGIPALRYFAVLAIVVGIAFAVMLRLIPRKAGLVTFTLTAVMVVCLASIPGADDSRRGEEMDLKDLSAAAPVVVPAPPPVCDRTAQCDEDPKKPQPPSPFDGTWEAKMHDLPGITVIIADAGGGEIGGVVTFFFQMRGDDGKWQVKGKSLAPLLAAHADSKGLVFEVQRKKHGSWEFGANAKFRMELTGKKKALLYNLSEPVMEPSRLNGRRQKSSAWSAF